MTFETVSLECKVNDGSSMYSFSGVCFFARVELWGPSGIFHFTGTSTGPTLSIREISVSINGGDFKVIPATGVISRDENLLSQGKACSRIRAAARLDECHDEEAEVIVRIRYSVMETPVKPETCSAFERRWETVRSVSSPFAKRSLPVPF